MGLLERMTRGVRPPKREPRVQPRKIRLHFTEDVPSLDGIYLGIEAGHYVLVKTELDNGDVRVPLEGATWVPSERVLFMQVTQ